MHTGTALCLSGCYLSNDTKRCMQVLVELAMERDQDIPALIYEGRSTVRPAWNSLCCAAAKLTSSALRVTYHAQSLPVWTASCDSHGDV